MEGGKRGLSPASPRIPPPNTPFLQPSEIIIPNKGNEQNDKREEQKAANDGRAGADGELAAGEVAEHVGHGHGDGVEKKHVAVIQEDEQRPEVGGEVEDFGQRGSLNEIHAQTDVEGDDEETARAGSEKAVVKTDAETDERGQQVDVF